MVTLRRVPYVIGYKRRGAATDLAYDSIPDGRSPNGFIDQNVEAERLARELARSRGVSVTEAIRQSLENEIARENLTSRHNESDLIVRLMEIAEQAGRIAAGG